MLSFSFMRAFKSEMKYIYTFFYHSKIYYYKFYQFSQWKCMHLLHCIMRNDVIVLFFSLTNIFFIILQMQAKNDNTNFKKCMWIWFCIWTYFACVKYFCFVRNTIFSVHPFDGRAFGHVDEYTKMSLFAKVHSATNYNYKLFLDLYVLHFFRLFFWF